MFSFNIVYITIQRSSRFASYPPLPAFYSFFLPDWFYECVTSHSHKVTELSFVDFV